MRRAWTFLLLATLTWPVLRLGAQIGETDNCVVVITGRERGLVSQWLGDLPVWVVAENGVFVRLGGPSTEWACPLEPVEPNNDWKACITPVPTRSLDSAIRP